MSENSNNEEMELDLNMENLKIVILLVAVVQKKVMKQIIIVINVMTQTIFLIY